MALRKWLGMKSDSEWQAWHRHNSDFRAWKWRANKRGELFKHNTFTIYFCQWIILACRQKGIWGLLFCINFPPFHLNNSFLLMLHYVSVSSKLAESVQAFLLKRVNAHTHERKKKRWGQRWEIKYYISETDILAGHNPCGSLYFIKVWEKLASSV